MIYDFDALIERTTSDSAKWRHFDADVLPMWVADMDFVSPEPVLRALHERVSHGVFGYGGEAHELTEAICARLLRLYGWRVAPEEVVLFPGVVTGFNLACQAFTGPEQSVLIQPPVYMPFLTAPANAQANRQDAPLAQEADGRYVVDLERFEGAMDATTRMFLLCNPHNPVGRVYTRAELESMAEICLRQDVLICSDEIHAELVFAGHAHTPIASLDPEIARNTITLAAPSKTFNIPGLYCSFGVIPNPALRRKFQAARRGLVNEGNLLGMAAALAAFREGDEWLGQMMQYLQANRDYLFETVQRELPMLRMTCPEGTYLAWLDCRGAGIEEKAGDFFLEKARVALVDGAAFGPGGAGFVRINFGCPRATLTEALERMKRALEGR